MSIIVSIFGLIILFAPTALKVWRDRNGVKHPDPTFITFIGLMIGSGLVVLFMNLWGRCPCDVIPVFLLWGKYSIVSASFYASTFPSWINLVHLKNGVTMARVNRSDWGNVMVYRTYRGYSEIDRKELLMHIVSHLSKTAWPDKIWWWRAIGWKGRLIVNSLILIGGLYLYFM